MTHVVLVGLGGFFGSILRYLLGIILSHDGKIPLPTLIINLLGSFLIGLVLSLLANKVNQNIYNFVVPGLLGGFTTYSAFSAELLMLNLKGNYLYAICYSLLSLIGGLLAAYLGHCLAKNL